MRLLKPPDMREAIKAVGVAVFLLMAVACFFTRSYTFLGLYGMPLAAIGTVLTLILYRIVRRLHILARRRTRLNLCPKCNYDRTGLAAGAVCPECGAARSSAT